jgi:3-hydroxybutyryl-CoA dehydrogenase
MKIIVSCLDARKAELTANGLLPRAEVIYIRSLQERTAHFADAFIDLDFENNPDYIRQLETVPVQLVIVNSVDSTLAEINPSFIRINAWPTFLSSALLEASCLDDNKKTLAEQVLSVFNKKIEWIPDEPGFITPRIISMIINEAYFALSEGVSTKEEMDTAMKLGTNYPYGPFEWSEKIGLGNIATLLSRLSRQQTRYTPCRLLVEEYEQTHSSTSTSKTFFRSL